MRLKCMILGLSVILAGCGTYDQTNTQSNGDSEPQSKPRPQVDVDSHFSSAQSTLGEELFKEVFKENQDQNVMVSPYSVQLALLMTANGLAEADRDLLLEALNLDGTDLNEINQEIQNLTESFDTLPYAELKTAHSVWHRGDLSVEEEYQELLHTYFNGEVQPFAENKPEIAINKWVDDKTDGYIDELIKQVPGNVVAYLINAVYFDANWKYPFEEDLTKPEPFYLLNGESVQHPMMNQVGGFELLEEQTFRALKIPYEDDGISMAVILPEEGEFNEVAGSLDTSVFWTDNWSKTELDLRLPSFTFSADYTLIPSLSEIGLEPFLNRGLDFSPLFGPNSIFGIDDVIHKTYINVDEEGTEAAAVTAVVLEESATIIEENFIVDRPFLFAIIDEKTETILFMGSVVEPI